AHHAERANQPWLRSCKSFCARVKLAFRMKGTDMLAADRVFARAYAEFARWARPWPQPTL
ncbi:MAG: hypothetical protein M3Q31_26425, partial [Actinomycetota bacterium]|nr:hypothetical protein [Actinomycetota bacterium]